MATDICPAPSEGEDPYSMEDLPQNLNYSLRMKDGIIYVYDNEDALKKDQPQSLPYPDLETFAIDMSHVLAMIADGPTWVSSCHNSLQNLKHLLKGTVHPDMKKCCKCTHSGNPRCRWVCFFIKQTRGNVPLHHLLTSESTAVNGCHHIESTNSW